MKPSKKHPKKPPAQNYDVIIVGGGLAGLSLACLLGETAPSLNVACIDRDDPQRAIDGDFRTTAISYGSSRILNRAGLWKDMEKLGCPIRDIRIFDKDTPLLLQFLSEEMNGKNFGWILKNSDLRKIMREKIAALPRVSHVPRMGVTNFENTGEQVNVTLESGQTLSGRLVIGADGRGSLVRDWLDIPTRRWNYGQRAVICNIAHENPHENRAIENFWPQGPFAILPVNDDETGRHISSLVFTEHGPKSASLMKLDDEAFRQEVAGRFPAFYGEIELASPRQCYPLSLIHAARYIGPRMALVADAAHAIHPVAGQGLNLGFRDIAELAGLIAQAAEKGEDIGAQDLLETYQRRRRPDNVAMAAVTDALVRLFSNNLAPVRILRRAGLRAVAALPPAKRFFMKNAMGTGK